MCVLSDKIWAARVSIQKVSAWAEFFFPSFFLFFLLHFIFPFFSLFLSSSTSFTFLKIWHLLLFQILAAYGLETWVLHLPGSLQTKLALKKRRVSLKKKKPESLETEWPRFASE